MPEPRKRPAPFQAAGMDVGTSAKISRAAHMRGWTLAQYIKALVELHEDMRHLESDITIDRLLAHHGLKAVRE